MNKERELLENWVSQFGNLRHDFNLLTETKELLAQPEPFSPDWATYRQGVADSKREPLSEATINYYLERLGSHFKWDDGFEAGVKYAEKAHGIGGGEC